MVKEAVLQVQPVNDSHPGTVPKTAGPGRILSTDTNGLVAWLVSGAFDGQIAFVGELTPALISATANNYNPTGLSTAAILRLSSSGAQSITGIQGGVKGRLLVLCNVGASDITLLSSSGGSDPQHRFFFVGGVYLLCPNASVVLVWDSVSSRWRTMGPTVDGNIINDGSGTTPTCDFNFGPFHTIGPLGGNTTVTLLAPPRHRHVQIQWKQDATGGRTIAFSPTPKWVAGTVPAWGTGANDRNTLTLFWNGTDYEGSGLVDLS